MKKLTMILGILVLVGAIAVPGMAWDTGSREGLPASEAVYQDVFSANFKMDNQALGEQMAKAMNNAFVKSFADRMAQVNCLREYGNTEITGLKLLQARLSFDLIQHGMEKTDAETVVKEFEKSPEKVDVGLILNTVLRAYPKEMGFILPICSAQFVLDKHYES